MAAFQQSQQALNAFKDLTAPSISAFGNTTVHPEQYAYRGNGGAFDIYGQLAGQYQLQQAQKEADFNKAAYDAEVLKYTQDRANAKLDLGVAQLEDKAAAGAALETQKLDRATAKEAATVKARESAIRAQARLKGVTASDADIHALAVANKGLPSQGVGKDLAAGLAQNQQMETDKVLRRELKHKVSSQQDVRRLTGRLLDVILDKDGQPIQGLIGGAASAKKYIEGAKAQILGVRKEFLKDAAVQKDSAFFASVFDPRASSADQLVNLLSYAQAKASDPKGIVTKQDFNTNRDNVIGSGGLFADVRRLASNVENLNEMSVATENAASRSLNGDTFTPATYKRRYVPQARQQQTRPVLNDRPEAERLSEQLQHDHPDWSPFQLRQEILKQQGGR